MFISVSMTSYSKFCTLQQDILISKLCRSEVQDDSAYSHLQVSQSRDQEISKDIFLSRISECESVSNLTMMTGEIQNSKLLDQVHISVLATDRGQFSSSICSKVPFLVPTCSIFKLITVGWVLVLQVFPPFLMYF